MYYCKTVMDISSDEEVEVLPKIIRKKPVWANYGVKDKCSITCKVCKKTIKASGGS